MACMHGGWWGETRVEKKEEEKGNGVGIGWLA